MLSVQRPMTAPGGPGRFGSPAPATSSRHLGSPKTPNSRPVTPAPTTARTRKSTTNKSSKSTRSLGSHSSTRSRSPVTYSKTSVYNIPPITMHSPSTKFRQMSSVTLCVAGEDDEVKRMEDKYNSKKESMPRQDEEEMIRNEEKKTFDSDIKKVASAMDARHLELEDLRKLFVEMSGGSVSLNYEMFSLALQYKGLCDENIAGRMFHYLDTDQSGKIDFREFMVGVLNMQGINDAPFPTKLRFFYEVFDTNCDGGISRMELYRVLKSGLVVNIPHKDLINYVGYIFAEAEFNATKISIEEFTEICERNGKVREFIEENLQCFDFSEASAAVMQNDGKPKIRLAQFDFLKAARSSGHSSGEPPRSP